VLVDLVPDQRVLREWLDALGPLPAPNSSTSSCCPPTSADPARELAVENDLDQSSTPGRS
jgi:hypothetical protein